MCRQKIGFCDQLLTVPWHLQHYSSTVPPVKWLTIQHNCQSVRIGLNLLVNHSQALSFPKRCIHSFQCICGFLRRNTFSRTHKHFSQTLPTFVVVKLARHLSSLSFVAICYVPYYDCVVMFPESHRALQVHSTSYASMKCLRLRNHVANHCRRQDLVKKQQQKNPL